MPVTPGTVLEGKYRIEREIGRGGMGVVYEATHLMLDRKVAVKLLSAGLVDRPDMANRMIREARTVGTLGHPNIVAVTDLSLHKGSPFIVMELLAGVSLEAELAQRGPMSLVDAVAIIDSVLDALDAVHLRGIVHRDIKAANVMLVRDAKGRRVVKVLDFGIAKITQGDELGTKTSFVLGTPLGMAPEQALGEEVDARADLHAVGSLLYAMLVGEAPYAAANAQAVVARMLEGRFKPATTRVRSLPGALDAVIARALARDRNDRWPDAASMRDALRACLPGAKPRPRPAAAAKPPQTPVPELEALPPRGVSRFAPTPVERLDLGTLLDRPPVRVAVAPVRLSKPWVSSVVLAVLAIAAGLGAWRWYVAHQDASPSVPPSAAESTLDTGRDRILLMVSTSPKDATVFVDDVRIEANPVELPRSESFVRVRVEAGGYVTRVMEVQPLRSRQVEIALERVKR